MIDSEILAAVVALPTTLLVVGSVAGATATITQADPVAVKRSIYATGGVLVGASLITGRVHMMVATAVAVGTIVAILNPIWFERLERDV